ncbi:glycosyltransferase family protein [Azospirillum halopraeferens]|uniref:glycosyltransferase family protein n=1 Tax=Azospirillum halopraeferens TaxID=34010 RepID=UPI00041D5A3B|nr:glycosyltransferase [Azospirillum halopraeferens]
MSGGKAPGAGGRIFFHVQHLLGIGHDRRAAAIARALDAAGLAVTVARGGHAVPGVDYGGAEIVPLPPARAADASFKVLLDGAGRPIDDAWREARRTTLLNAFQRARPDLLLVESFPFARRAFRFELLPLIAAARAAGLPVAVSVRDILVAKPDPVRVEEVVRTVLDSVDLVLVHGDPALIPLDATFAAADRIAGRIRYTGYVASPPAAAAGADAEANAGDGAGEVLVSVGGGAVGLPLLRAALAARPLSPAAALPWRLLAGPDVPDADVAALAARARSMAVPATAPATIVERARPDFPALLRRCRLSISQAGYNTVLDLLQAGCRALVVPFAAGSETEQALRAGILADRGRLTVVDEATLTPDTLAAGIARALALPPPAPLPLRLDGARETARLLGRAIGRGG